MNILAHILIALAPVLLAITLPFIWVARGRPMLTPFFWCWGLLVFWFTFFSLIIPLMCSAVSQELAHTVAADWVPDPRGIPLIAIIGWFWAAIIGAGSPCDLLSEMQIL
jgi:hypothetical protein